MSPGICLPRGLLQILVILFFLCYCSIRPSCYVLSLPKCYPKIICFFWIRLLICPCAFFTDLLIEFSLITFEGSVLLVLLDPVPVSFESHFFRQYLLIYFFQSQSRRLLSFLSFPSILSLCIFSSFDFSIILAVSSFVLLASFASRFSNCVRVP